MFDCWKVTTGNGFKEQNRAGEEKGVEILTNRCLCSEFEDWSLNISCPLNQSECTAMYRQR